MTFPHYTAHRIATILHARILAADSDHLISHLLTDSRRLTQAESTLFFALSSERNDGHKYIDQLYQAGVRNFVIGSDYSFPIQFTGCSVLVVQDTLVALQALAAFHRQQFSLPVTAITGSNGKTIVKEWLYQLLKDEFTLVRSPKSYNSQIGVPLSVWQLRSENTLALFEAGISKPNEMERLAKVIKPTIGIFTNLGSAHDEGFENKEQKLSEKFKLICRLRCGDLLQRPAGGKT